MHVLSQGILKNQSLICRRLLEEGRHTALPRITVRNGAVMVHVPDAEFAALRADPRFGVIPAYKRRAACAADNWVSLSDLWHAGANDPWERMSDYFEQCLALFATLCVGGNSRTRDVVSTFVPKDV